MREPLGRILPSLRTPELLIISDSWNHEFWVLILIIMEILGTTFAALSMVEAGYSVFANSDASGTTSALGRDLSNQRMLNAGVQVLSPFAVFGELMRDWRTPPEGEEVWPLLEYLLPEAGMLARFHGATVESGEVMPGQDAIPW